MKRVVLVLTLALLAAGCGGGDGDAPRSASSSSSTPTPSTGSTPSPTASASDLPLAQITEGSPDQRALRTAVQLYSDAFLTGNAEVSYALLSLRCRNRVTEEQWDQLLAMAAQKYGQALPVESYEALISGDTARVSYGFSDSSIDQTREPWVREDGRWREDDC